MAKSKKTRYQSLRKSVKRHPGEYGVPEAPPPRQVEDPRAGLQEAQWEENDYDYSDQPAPWMRSRADEGHYFDQNNEPEHPYPRKSETHTSMFDSMKRSVKNFFGKGPKGYRRSDERIYEDVCELLYHHPEVDASDVEVAVKNGVVTFTGSVEDRWTKREIEDVAEDVSGVKDIHNQIFIREFAPYPERDLPARDKRERNRSVQ